MAQLRDTVVSGSLRATDTIYSTTNQFQILKIPTSSNGTTYGPGTNGQILKSNGTSVYWASDNNSDTNVTQAAAITTAGAYPIILANSTATSAVTGTVNKTSTLTYNPNTKALVTGGTVDGYTLAAASAKAVTDSSSASAIGTGTSLPTERDIYYGLPTINNAHNYTSSTKIYAPTSGGTSGQFLRAQGETSTPEWANIITTDITSIKKIYTNFYSTATDDNGRTAFCFKITRPNATTVWHIKFKVRATIPNHLEYASMDWDIDYYGYGNNEKAHYAKVNPGATYAIRYLVNAYPTSTADNIVLMGFQLYSNNETSTDYARTVEVSLIDYDNCTIEFLDNLIRQSSITISNYTRRSIDLYAAGFQETSDNNSGYVTTSSSANSFLVGSTPVYKYSLFMLKPDGTVASIVTSEGQGTTKQKNTSGFVPGMIWYNWSSGNIAANGRVVYAASHEQLDFRYSSNCGTTLTAGKPVYIVGTIGADGLFYLDDDIYTQTLPTAVDNKVYMFVGTALAANGYQILFLETHSVYQYKNNGIQEYVRDAATINGLTVKTAVPENALFTDTKYESKAAASNGTAVSLVTTGEKYIWNQTSNNTVLNSSTGTKGDIIYWSAANTPARLGANTTTTPKYLCMTSSAPVWQEIIPTSNLDLTAITTAEIDAIITGNSSGTLTVPTATSQLTNDSGFLVNTDNIINLNNYGMAIGQNSTATSSSKKFEINSNYATIIGGTLTVNYDSTFNGGINGITNYITDTETIIGFWNKNNSPTPIRRAVFNWQSSATGTINVGTLDYSPSILIQAFGGFYRTNDNIFRTIPFTSYANIGWSVSPAIDASGNVNIYCGTSESGDKTGILVVDYVPIVNL